jgi:hypothetical protein
MLKVPSTLKEWAEDPSCFFKWYSQIEGTLQVHYKISLSALQISGAPQILYEIF